MLRSLEERTLGRYLLRGAVIVFITAGYSGQLVELVTFNPPSTTTPAGTAGDHTCPWPSWVQLRLPQTNRSLLCRQAVHL